MICHTTKELLAEIKKNMDMEDIQLKDLAARINKSQQSVSQYFKNGNPNCNTVFEICNALDLQIEISKGDTSE